MTDDTAGDPMSPHKWCRVSTYSLSQALKSEAIDISPKSVAKLLKDNDYSLRSNRKTIAETHHPERNRQFDVIAQSRKRFEDSGQPIISVDSKKKELVGNFKNPGRAWTKQADEVLAHDFRSEALGIAHPYGIYEPVRNLGTVIVGVSYNTPEFAADSIELWLNSFAWDRYQNVKELLILSDSGGSNGARPRLWKYALYEKISKVYGITIRVCHYPAGASKWNPVEHRLFSYITCNWQGRPLRSYEIVLGCIESTQTKQGLCVEARMNPPRSGCRREISGGTSGERMLHVLVGWDDSTEMAYMITVYEPDQ